MEKGIFFYNICTSPDGWEHDYDKYFPLLREHGIDGLQFSDSEIIAEGEDALLAAMKKHGMKTYVIHSMIKSITEDAEQIKAARQRAEALFELAVRFDCKRIMLVAMAGADKSVLDDRQKSLELAAQMFAYCRDLGQKRGIDVYIENIGMPNLPYASAEEVLAIIDRVDGLKYCLDTGNFYYAGYDVHEAYEKFKGMTELVHIKNGYYETVDDENCAIDKPLDEGERNFPLLFEKLKADGVGVPFILEFTAPVKYADIFRDERILTEYLD